MLRSDVVASGAAKSNRVNCCDTQEYLIAEAIDLLESRALRANANRSGMWWRTETSFEVLLRISHSSLGCYSTQVLLDAYFASLHNTLTTTSVYG